MRLDLDDLDSAVGQNTADTGAGGYAFQKGSPEGRGFCHDARE